MKRTTIASIAITIFSAMVSVSNAATLPHFDAANFIPGAPVDNVYFPLIPGSTQIFQGEFEDEGEIVVESFELSALGLVGPTILGVPTHVQRDLAFEGGLKVEQTSDYYAQDIAGNVWYFGEDVVNFVYDEDDNLVSTNSSSSWRAGVNGALPGFIMPVDPMVGFNYFQESAALDMALDEGTINSLDEVISLGIDFNNVLRILETTSLDLDVRGFKYYAPGIGLIREEEGLDEFLMNPELTVDLIAIQSVQPVPLPGALVLLSTGLAGLAVTKRRAS